MFSAGMSDSQPALSNASHLGGGGELEGGGLGGGWLQAADLWQLELTMTAGSSESWQVASKAGKQIAEAI